MSRGPFGLSMAKFASLLALATGAASASSRPVPDVLIAPGVRMPMLAFGSAKSSFKGECTVSDAVEQWLRLGGRHIDTANDYNTQGDVGRGIAASGVPRSDIFITTKIPGPIGRQKAIDMILNASLPQLGVQYVDLVLIHFPCLDFKPYDHCSEEGRAERLDTWKGLQELKSLGKIRAVGVSNYNAAHVAEIFQAFGAGPAVNQVEWHLGYHDEALLVAMKEDKVTLEAWGSLTGPTTSTAGHAGISLSDPRVKAVAQRHNASAAQAALRWSAQKGVVPVTATCSKEHALGDLSAWEFDLSTEDVSLLDSLQAQQAAYLLV